MEKLLKVFEDSGLNVSDDTDGYIVGPWGISRKEVSDWAENGLPPFALSEHGAYQNAADFMRGVTNLAPGTKFVVQKAEGHAGYNVFGLVPSKEASK